MTPRISIIVPVYNVERFLPLCLDSLTGQTLRDVEIICVDDGSNDRSIDILKDYAARDSRIRIIMQHNKRQGGARNTGFDAANGEWIAFVDSDDWVDTDYFERLLDAAVRNNADIACANLAKHRRLKHKYTIRYTREECFDDVQTKFTACNCPPNFHVTNKLYRRSRLLEKGMRFDENIYYEDVKYLATVLVSLGRVVTVPDTDYHYVIHRGSTVASRQSHEKQLQKYNAHKAFIAFADKHGIDVGSKFRDTTMRNYAVGFVSLLKIRHNGLRKIYKLFDMIPIWTTPTR
ncbi:MAG: glycosyltransferase family 2 protein [Alistipes sp.]